MIGDITKKNLEKMTKIKIKTVEPQSELEVAFDVEGIFDSTFYVSLNKTQVSMFIDLKNEQEDLDLDLFVTRKNFTYKTCKEILSRLVYNNATVFAGCASVVFETLEEAKAWYIEFNNFVCDLLVSQNGETSEFAKIWKLKKGDFL